MNIKITKLPDDLDLDKIVKERMIETYRRCPYCFDKEFHRLLDKYIASGIKPKNAHEKADDVAKSYVDFNCIYTTEKRCNYYERIKNRCHKATRDSFLERRNMNGNTLSLSVPDAV